MAISTKKTSDFVNHTRDCVILDGVANGKSVLLPDSYKNAVLAALEQFSKDKPVEAIVDIAGTSPGLSVIPASDLEGYDEEFSADPIFEYPISTSGTPSYIDRRDWAYYRHPTDGLTFRLLGVSISSGQSARVTFKIRRVIDDNDAALTTVPDADFYAFCDLAGAKYARMLADFYKGTSEGTYIGGGDVTYFRSKASEWEKAEKDLLKAYNDHMGIGKDVEVSAASVVVNNDLNDSMGRDRLTHSRRFR